MTPRPAIVAALLLATGCQPDGGTAGDCNARFGLDGVVYRAHNLLPQAYRIRGVDPRVAIAIDGSDWTGTYVATDVPRSEWPDRLTP